MVTSLRHGKLLHEDLPKQKLIRYILPLPIRQKNCQYLDENNFSRSQEISHVI